MRNKSDTRKLVSKENRFKIKNWSEYNQALKQRGSLEIWIDEEAKESWYYQGETQRGAQYEYSDSCIELACIVREIYKLGYRQTEGFLESLIKRLNWQVKVPDYTIINRRRKSLDIKIGGCRKEKKYIVMDSTGAKIYGEGEWKVRQHGWSKHRTWMKIHLAVDERTGEIESCATTTNSIDDAAMVKPLLDEVSGEIAKLAADGAYDKRKVYTELEKRKIKPIIPPRKGARIEKHGNKGGKEKPRDKNIRAIRKLGRKKWKKQVGYHRRSIAEATMYRFKNTFGDKLTSRILIQQKIEVKIKCKVLNKMATLGMPITIKLKNAA
jgi:IS5 family transposase